MGSHLIFHKSLTFFLSFFIEPGTQFLKLTTFWGYLEVEKLLKKESLQFCLQMVWAICKSLSKKNSTWNNSTFYVCQDEVFQARNCQAKMSS